MPREPGEDDDLDDHVSVGEMLQLFKLGYRGHGIDEQLTVCAQRDKNARRARYFDLERFVVEATLETRNCKLCGEELIFVGPKKTPFTSRTLQPHASTCLVFKTMDKKS